VRQPFFMFGPTPDAGGYAKATLYEWVYRHHTQPSIHHYCGFQFTIQ